MVGPARSSTVPNRRAGPTSSTSKSKYPHADKKYDPRAAGCLCDECPLSGKPVVPPEGNAAKVKLILVGEGPGFHEEQQLRPFVGRSGQMLNSLLQHVGIDRKDTFITNAVLCRTPELRLGADAEPDKKTLNAAAAKCRPRLLRELKRYSKSLAPVVAMGATAVRSVTNRKTVSIQKARGFVWHVPAVTEAPVLPTVHPAFVLRAPAWEGVIASDFLRAARFSQHRISATGPAHDPFRVLGKLDLHLAPPITELKNILDKLGPVIGADVETTRDKATIAHLFCLGLSDGRTSVVIPWASTRTPTTRYYGREHREMVRIVQAALSKRTAITHNGPGFDHIVLNRNGVHIRKWEDTLIGHHVYASHMPQRLDHVVSMYNDAPPWKIVGRRPAAATDERGAWDPEKLKDDELWTYNAIDAALQARTWKFVDADLRARDTDVGVYETDKKNAEVCMRMQTRGIYIDRARQKKVRIELTGRVNSYVGILRSMAGFQIRPHRLNEVRTVLFDKLKAPVLRRSVKTKAAVTDANVLQAYTQMEGDIGRFAKTLLKWREAAKLRSTFVDNAMPEEDGRLHTAWRSWGTVTGRYASRSPNVMNLPRGSTIRSMYCAPPGRVLVIWDLKQAEMRVAAYLSGDPKLIAACESSDMHEVNAQALFGELPPKYLSKKDERAGAVNKMWKRLRDMAKNAGFAMNYLAGAETVYARLMSQGFTLPHGVRDVEVMLQALRVEYAGYFKWQEKELAGAAALAEVYSPIQRRRRWVGHEPIAAEVANFPIQSCVADIMNTVLPRLEKLLPSDTWLTAQVHDATYIDTPKTRAKAIARLCKKVAETPVRINGILRVFPADVEIKGRWAEVV